MSLPSPNLDDRNFKDLMASSMKILERKSIPWTDLSPSDPGVTLLELFAHLSETVLYRLNRVPQKAYVEFLNLIGSQINSSSSALVKVEISRKDEIEGDIEIPRSTKIIAKDSDGRGGEVEFLTVRNSVLKAGEQSVEVSALNCKEVNGEIVGKSTGLAGQVFELKMAPVISPSGDAFDLLVASEIVESHGQGQRGETILFKGKSFKIWKEVDSFAGYGPTDLVYVSDRFSGKVSFAPEISGTSIGACPERGAQLITWYRYGGGVKGNVGVHSLKEIELEGVEVTNHERATGGIDEESLDEAMKRGPLELHSLRRAVTASDFESIAMHESRMIARAKAYTRAEQWAFAEPGTVDVILVPFVESGLRKAELLTQEYMSSIETEEVLERINRVLDSRKPMGTQVQVRWAKYKAVSVRATLLIGQESRKDEVAESVRLRLRSAINPLPTEGNNERGWEYGSSLHASSVYDICLSDPAVKVVKDVVLKVDYVPDVDVSSLSRSRFYPFALFSCSGSDIYRSVDDGQGWEKVGDFGSLQAQAVHCDPKNAGHLVVVSESKGRSGKVISTLSFSEDDGETWLSWSPKFDFEIYDCSWLERGGNRYLIIASASGLFELPYQMSSVPNLLSVDPDDQNLGFYSVTSAFDSDGVQHLAVAGKDRKGIYHSTLGSEGFQFQKIGLEGSDIRVLKTQKDGARRFLWAGTATAGNQPGDACFRKEIRRGGQDPVGWKPLKSGWTGGSVHDIAFMGRYAVAASHKAGVLILDTAKQRPKWIVPHVGSGLPNRTREWFYPIRSVTLNKDRNTIFAGGDQGVYASADRGQSYLSVSQDSFTEKVSLPPSWLFCSGSHEINVVYEL